jgi:hypothetical protein
MDARGVHLPLDTRPACRAQQRRLLLVPGERIERVLELCDVSNDFEMLEPREHHPVGLAA